MTSDRCNRDSGVLLVYEKCGYKFISFLIIFQEYINYKLKVKVSNFVGYCFLHDGRSKNI